MESWVETKNVIFWSSFNATILFLNISKEVFKVQGAWHSPNTSPNMVLSQIICTEQLSGLEVWDTSPLLHMDI
jgi:hypothetical protein